MRLRVTVDGEERSLELRPENGQFKYRFEDGLGLSGTASVSEIRPGVFSVLLSGRSYLIYLTEGAGELEAWTGEQRQTISVKDARDRSRRVERKGGQGTSELRAQMPGKVIKVLVTIGQTVEAGQGLIVVEAMKMQNEMKASKSGTVSKILVAEGATVTAGEPLIIVE